MDTNINLNKTHIEKILKQRAAMLKIDPELNKNEGQRINVIEFLLAGERYAIDLSFVNAVIKINNITALPGTPAFMLGIINVRGRIISVIDIKKIFNLPEKGITNLNRVIVVKHLDVELGILADEIFGNSTIQLDTLQSDISTITEVPENFILGIRKDRLIAFDIEKFLLSDRIIIDEHVVA